MVYGGSQSTSTDFEAYCIILTTLTKKEDCRGRKVDREDLKYIEYVSVRNPSGFDSICIYKAHFEFELECIVVGIFCCIYNTL